MESVKNTKVFKRYKGAINRIRKLRKKNNKLLNDYFNLENRRMNEIRT